MQWNICLRRYFAIIIFIFVIYLIVFRRRSSQLFVTALDVDRILNSDNSNHTKVRRIPRIIHQTWRTHDPPSRWNHTSQSVRELNANLFEYRIWSDADMHSFVRREYPDIYKNTFVKYKFPIQRVDAFRYMVLYSQGGLYIDMDNGASRSFDTLLDVLEVLDPDVDHLAAFPRTSPVGISNGFMISTKGHPLMKILVSRLSLFNQNYLIDYFTVMLSTGPSYLSINEFYFDRVYFKAAVRILDEIVYSHIYTWHTPGSSWHGSDAKTIIRIFRWWQKSSLKVIIFYLLFFCMFLSFLLFLCCCPRKMKNFSFKYYKFLRYRKFHLAKIKSFRI